VSRPTGLGSGLTAPKTCDTQYNLNGTRPPSPAATYLSSGVALVAWCTALLLAGGLLLQLPHIAQRGAHDGEVRPAGHRGTQRRPPT
jgi:hypothetical protein